MSKKHLIANDPELTKLNAQAKKMYADQKHADRTKTILADLKEIPASSINRNAALYKELVAMHPSNKTYKEQKILYQKKIEQEKVAKIAKAERQKRIEEQFSAWDGSHIKLARQIKATMHDPGSYDHVKTVYWDHGAYLLVQTTFRGKNAFGGLVMNSIKAKVADNGTILQIVQ